MSTHVIILALAIVAVILAAVEEFRAQGQSILGWAVVLLALAVVLLVQ